MGWVAGEGPGAWVDGSPVREQSAMPHAAWKWRRTGGESAVKSDKLPQWRSHSLGLLARHAGLRGLCAAVSPRVASGSGPLAHRLSFHFLKGLFLLQSFGTCFLPGMSFPPHKVNAHLFFTSHRNISFLEKPTVILGVSFNLVLHISCHRL